MPATERLSGTPAWSSDIVDAQTEPMDGEPLEGPSPRRADGSRRGTPGGPPAPAAARAASAPWPDLGALAAHPTVSRWDVTGGEVRTCACSGALSPGERVWEAYFAAREVSMFAACDTRIWSRRLPRTATRGGMRPAGSRRHSACSGRRWRGRQGAPESMRTCRAQDALTT